MSEVTNMNNQFLRDIWGIIDTARAQAVRSVDFCRVQMYWHMGKRIFEEEQQGNRCIGTWANVFSRKSNRGKTVPITARTSSRTWLSNWNLNTEAGSPIVSWLFAVNFIGFIRL